MWNFTGVSFSHYSIFITCTSITSAVQLTSESIFVFIDQLGSLAVCVSKQTHLVTEDFLTEGDDISDSGT